MYSKVKRIEIINKFSDWVDDHTKEYGFVLGEYAFQDYYQDEETKEYLHDEFFYEDLKENVLSTLKERSVMDKLLNVTPYQIIDDIVFDQPSSKSGVIVYLKHSIDTDIYLDTDSPSYEISEAYRAVQENRQALDRAIEIVQPIIEEAATGIRSGCFSNGEVVFSPIGQGRQSNWQSFSAYYNPNLE